MQVVNIVASGSLDAEIDLEAVATELDDVVDYNPGKYPAAYFRFSGTAPLITLYRTGKYIITGSGSEDETSVTRAKFLEILSDKDVISAPEDDWFALQNFVCVAEVGHPLDLNTLATSLGLERTEYEPEQFPGLTFRPPDAPCVVLLFASGRLVITGCPNIRAAETTFESVQSKINNFSSNK